MTRPLVSVIVPAYNAARFLEEAVRSAQNQTYADLEIIVVDDASTDETLAMAESFAKQDRRVTVLRHQENAGLAATRNTGIRSAKGEWIAFLDADDVFLPRKIESQLSLGDPTTNLLFTNYCLWNGKKDLAMGYRKRSHFPEGDVFPRLICASPFCPSTVMLRREMLEKVGGFDPSFRAVEDWDLWLRMAEQGLRVRGVWEPQLRYRVWQGNLSKNSDKMTFYTIRVFESALARQQPAERRKKYLRALKYARANREFSLARKFVGSDRRALGTAIQRAWLLRPLRLKWLLWRVALLWPASLGGEKISAPVNRRILAKW